MKKKFSKPKVLREFASGPYLIRHELVDIGGVKPVATKSAYSKEGRYIGDPEDAERLWKKYGIETFEPRDPKKPETCCSVGWSPRDKLWYGWSHRAIWGYKTKKEAAEFAESVS